MVDAIKTEVATMVANQNFVVRPTAVYMNPILADYIDQEAKASRITLDSMEVVAASRSRRSRRRSASCRSSATRSCRRTRPASTASPPGERQELLRRDPDGVGSRESGDLGKEYNPNPRLFQLGLVGNLAGQFVGVKFDTIIFKGASYAHAVVCVNRP
ncbi:hypothetical protein BTO02_33555 (plasmid) [Paraburkholderia sp. SOS3]|nr:hypothetical protein BTO02_33555 [Paraburkholderia sp. SOS3]